MTSTEDTISIQLGDLQLIGSNYNELIISESADQPGQKQIAFDFVITGGQEYHDVTSLLYEPTVEVQIPTHQLHFHATVHNYFTSVPKLEKDTDTVDVHLELIEVLNTAHSSF